MRVLAILVFNVLLFNFARAEEKIVLPDIEVKAKKDAISDQYIANTQKQIFDRQDIENLGVMTIGEVLGKLPGVESGALNSEGAASNRVRGMSRDSIDIRVDGERPAGGSRIISGVIGRLPVGDLERVEILRGSSAEYGGSASVTVNLVMKKALPKKSTAVKAALGLNETTPTGQFTLTQTGGEKGFSWSLPITLNLHRNPNYRDIARQDRVAGVRTLMEEEEDDGMMRFREFVISPRMTWKSERDSLTLSPIFFDGQRKRNSETDLFTFTNPADGTGLVSNGDRFSHENSHRQIIRLRTEGEKFFGESKISGRLAFNHGRNTADLIRKTYDAMNVLSTTLEKTDSTESEFNSALRWDKPVDLHMISFGAEYVQLMKNEEQDFGGSYVENSEYDTSQREGVLWVQDEWNPQDAFTLTTGLRMENMRLDADNSAQQHVGWLPSIAARWEPQESWVIRSSIGAGLKMPKLDEISNSISRSVSANTPVEADIRGNPNLKPERSVNFEAVLERYLGKDDGMLSANVYVRATEDFTERRVRLEGIRWVDRPYNVGEALHWGIELDGKVRMDNFGWKGATLKSHLTLPRSRVDDEMLGVRRMAKDTPKYTLSVGLDQSLPRLASSYGVTLQLSGRSETDISGEQKGVSESRALLDAYWLYKLSPKFNLRISGKNLLASDFKRNNQYFSGLNEWQLYTQDQGYRSLLATLEGRW